MPSSQALVCSPKYAKGLPEADWCHDITSDGHDHAEGEGGAAQDHRTSSLRQPGAAGEEQQQKGPDDVELFLDAQRPVVQHRALGGVGHVLRGLRGEAPVRTPQSSIDEVEAIPLRSISGTNRNTAGGRGQHGGRERQKPPDAPGVELAERDGPGARDLVDEQTRDEEAGEHEEHVDADETSADHTDAGVERHDEEHCDGAQALDVATEPLTALPPRLGRGNVGVVWVAVGAVPRYSEEDRRGSNRKSTRPDSPSARRARPPRRRDPPSLGSAPGATAVAAGYWSVAPPSCDLHLVSEDGCGGTPAATT